MAEDNICITPELQKILDQIIDENRISEPKIIVKPGSDKGDGYIGVMTAVDIEGKDNVGSQKTLHLMVKRAHKSDALRAQIPIRKMYEKEIYIYNDLKQKLKDFEESTGTGNCFNNFAECLATSLEDKHETLVFNHLQYEGYKMWNRMVPMNVDHIEILLDTYAHFHSISFSMKNRNPHIFEEIKDKCKDVYAEDDVDKYMASYTSSLEYLIDNFKDDLTIVSFLENLKSKMGSLLELFVNHNKDIVLCHGDCWCNNMMFRYDDENNPEKPTYVILLDWQIAKTSSPLTDLCYFFYCSSSQEIVDNYRYYQKYYYDRLVQHSAEMGTDLKEIFSFETFLEDWNKFRYYGFMCAIFLMRIMVTEKDEARDFTKTAESGEHFADALNYKSVNEDMYLERIKGLILHLIETENDD